MEIKPKTTIWAILAGVFLFAVWGLYLIVQEIPQEWSSYALRMHYQIPGNFQTFLFVTPIFIFPVFLCLGWILGFPRWSYPFVVHVPIFSWYIANASTPGFRLFGYEMFGRELWGWRAWIPLLVIALIALAVTRSFRPIIRFFANIREDWTLLTFGMFGLMPLITAIMFDEVDRLFSLYFMAALTIIMVGTAIAYLAGVDHRMRVRALLSGIALSLVIVSVAPNIYWTGVMDVNIIPALVAGAVLFLFMFSPSLLALGRKKQVS